MKRSTFRFNLILAGLLLLNAIPAVAIGKRDISISRLESGERLEISPGYGLTINMMPIGKVNRAWLTDKSWMTISNENGACPNGGCGQSRFIYLHRIDKLSFDGLPSAVDGGTLLNLATVTGEILQFHIVRDRDGIPAYTSVYVQPEQQESEPVAYAPAPRPQLPPTPPINSTPLPSLSSTKPVDIPASLQPLLDDIPVTVQLDLDLTEKEDNSEDENQRKAKDSKDQKAIAKAVESEDRPDEKAIAKAVESEDRPDEKAIADASEPQQQPEAAEKKDSTLSENIESDKSPVKAKEETQEEASEAKEESTLPDAGAETDNNQVDESDEDEQPSEGSNDSAVLAKSNLSPSPAPTNQEIAGSLLRGLHSQRGKQEVGRSIHYYKAQDLIWLLKRYPKLSLDRAIAEARMDATVAKTLIEYGQQ